MIDIEPGPWGDSSYTIETFVSRGGMGVVYKARHSPGDEVRALKIFDPSPDFVKKLQQEAGWSEEECWCYLRRKFKEEADRLYSITQDCKNVRLAHVYDSSVSSSAVPWYAMDFISSKDGKAKSLSAVIENEESISPERIERWFSDLCESLDVLHGKGFIHRDIKPENILVDADDHAVLVDFGIVVEVDREPDLLGVDTIPHNIVLGSNGYEAPELKTRNIVTVKADVFSLGAVFWYVWSGDSYPNPPERWDAFARNGEDPEWVKKWVARFRSMLATTPEDRCERLMSLIGEVSVNDSGSSARPVIGESRLWARMRLWLFSAVMVAVVVIVCLIATNANRWNKIMRTILGAIPVVEVQANQERRQDVVTNQAEFVQPIVIDRPVVFTNKNWTPPAPMCPGQSAFEEGRTNATPAHAASEETRNVDLRTAANLWLRKNDIALGRSVFFNTTNVVVVGTASGSLPKNADRNEREILRNRLFRQAVFACSQVASPIGSTGCETLKHFHRIRPATDDKSEFEVLLIMRFYSGRQRSQRGRDLVNGWIAGQKKVDLQGPHRYIDCEGNLCGVGGVGSLDGDAFDEQLKRESRQMARIALGAPITAEWVENGPIMGESDTVILGGYDQYGCLAAFSDSDSDPEAVSVFSICKHKDSDEGFDPSAAAGRAVLKTPVANPEGYKSAAEQVRAYLEAKGVREGFNAADGSIVLVETDAFDCPDPRHGGQLFMQIEDAVLNVYRQAHVAILNVIGQNLTDEMYARAGIPQENRDRLRDVDWSLQGWERIRESLKIIALHGVKAVREEQSWNAETQKYEVALAFQWNPNAEREMKNLSMSSLSVDMPGKYSVMSWLEAQFDLDLVTSTGPLRYVDDKGDCWFIGVGVRELNLEEEAFFPDGCKINSQNAAQMMVRVSLYGGVTLFEKGKEIEVDRATANEKTNAAVVNGLKVALRHCREKVTHHGMRIIYQGKLKHVLSGKETIVTVVGIRASEVDFSNWMPIESRPRWLRIEENHLKN